MTSELILGIGVGGTIGIAMGMLIVGLIFRDAIITAFNMAGIKSDFGERLVTISNNELTEDELKAYQQHTADCLKSFVTQEWVVKNVLNLDSDADTTSDGEQEDENVEYFKRRLHEVLKFPGENEDDRKVYDL